MSQIEVLPGLIFGLFWLVVLGSWLKLGFQWVKCRREARRGLEGVQR